VGAAVKTRGGRSDCGCAVTASVRLRCGRVGWHGHCRALARRALESSGSWPGGPLKSALGWHCSSGPGLAKTVPIFRDFPIDFKCTNFKNTKPNLTRF
jgi:hypothetical protein